MATPRAARIADEPLLGQEDELCAPLHLLSGTLARDLLGIAVTDRLGHLPSSGARRARGSP
ncbi:MAG: hypothetical protein H0V38_01645 [Sporichthyaceae bacterium]|nr:hypothetical protein [Sporichthyaceae bacterium]